MVYATQAFAYMRGIELSEMVGKNLRQLVPDTVVPHPADVLQARMRGERPAREGIGAEMITGRGERVPFLVGVSLVTDDLGRPQGMTSLFIDISERKSLEAALRKERARIGPILENIGDAVFVTDPHGVIEYVNPAWERLNGYNAGEAVGQPASLLKSGQHPSPLFANLWETVRAGPTARR